jgi:hypothetical protein
MLASERKETLNPKPSTLTAHRQAVPEQLFVHVGFREERHHEQLALAQVQPWAAVDVAIQVQPDVFREYRVRLRQCSRRQC